MQRGRGSRDTGSMVDTEERKTSPRSLLDQLDVAIEMARDEEYELPCPADIETVRRFLTRLESLGRGISGSTWVTVGVDGRFGFVTDRPGFRVNYETADDGTYNLGVVNLVSGDMWARESVTEDEVVSELEHPVA